MSLVRWSFLHYAPPIPPTIADLVEDPGLGLRVLSGGATLDVPVQWVYVTDLPDPSPYLSEGDLVATNGLWRRARADSDRFVARLAAGRACGLVYGLEQRTRETPTDLVGACERHRLVLLELAHPHAFSGLAKAVAAGQAAEGRRELNHALRRQEALVHALSRGAGARGVLDVLVRQNGLPAVLLDPMGRALAARGTGADDLPAGAEESLAPHEAVPEPQRLKLPDGRELTAVCIGASNAVHGHLLCDRALGRLSDDDLAALDQARHFLEVELRGLEAVRRERARFAAELIDLVEAGEPRRGELTARLAAFGLTSRDGLSVLAMELEPDADESTVVGTAEWCLERLELRAVVAVRAREALVFAQAGAGRSCADALVDAFATSLPDHAVRIGVGSEAAGNRGLSRSLSEARNSLRLASAQEPVVDYTALASHRSLMDLQEPEIAGAFERSLLSPLEEHDAQRGTSLVATLEVFLDEGGQWKSSAERLHVHVNTLRHRLERVSALTGRDIATMDARVDFYLALDARRRRTGAALAESSVGASAKAEF